MKKVIIVGIAGPSASGKSLFSHTIVNEIGSKHVAIISEDCYYRDLSHLPMEERAKTNFDHPNAFEHDLLSRHLAQLKQGKDIMVPQYDHTCHNRKKEQRQVHNVTIVIIEGILLLAEPTLREQMDIRLFIDTPLDICFIRRLKRDLTERERTLESILTQYKTTVRPMYQQFVEPSKRYADIIIPNGGKNRIAIDTIKTRMCELLSQNGNYDNPLVN
ncbi:MAG: uridine kinase [Pseudomonadota bacterium]